MKKRRRTVILGAAGRDFHNFNILFRDNDEYEVISFTATQIPNVSDRLYPKELSGPLYPEGIPIVPEDDLESLITDKGADYIVFSYSDVSHNYVMHLASRINALGAEFSLPGTRMTMIESTKPVVAVCAVRTGCGKSQTTREVVRLLQEKGRKVVVVRHPMPYGDLARQAVQRFATYDDLKKHHCTIEEMEEYEPLINMGAVVFAGVDYTAILREAEKEADIVIWDGGNNDTPFFRPDFHITIVDPHRPGHEMLYHPGETNLRMADAILINKISTASAEGVQTVREHAVLVNPAAVMIEAASPLYLDNPECIKGKKVLVVEDGPTLTHGGMPYGAGVVAARKLGAGELIDPRPYAVGSIGDVYEKFPHIGSLLPAMGYSKAQIDELQQTINKVPCDVVVIATPIDLTKIVQTEKPSVRVRYELQVIGKPDLADLLEKF